MNETATTAAPGLERRMLPLLAELSQQLAMSLDLEQTLHAAVTRIAEFMDAEAAAVFLFDLAREQLVCRACAGPVDVRGLALPRGTGIVGRAVEQNSCQMVRDVHADPDFAGVVDKATGFATRSVLCAPLSTAEGPIGALQVLNKRSASGLFDEADRDALRLLAAPTALALSGARMASELLEQNRIKRELTMARRLQRSLLPRRRRGNYPVRALNLPAQEISGDFYDFFDLPDGRIAFALGDVSGKGLDAAFLMVRCASLLRWAGKEGLSPGRWLAQVNDELGEAIASGMFVCAVAGHYDPVRHEAVWASAGFPPALLVRKGAAIESFEAQGPPLGILTAMEFPEQRADLSGATLYLFSDGATDVRDEEGRVLGVEGMAGMLGTLADRPAASRLRAIVAQLRRFRVTDDTTLMLIEDHTAQDLLLELSFEARPGELAAMRHRLERALEGVVADEELRAQLVLAVDEACTNVIRHAYGGPCRAPIELRLSCTGDTLRIELQDYAPCVDPDTVRPRELGECRPGGLGLALIDHVMDSWHVEPCAQGRGNRLLMTRALACAAPGETAQPQGGEEMQ
ncbi:MAG TPA: SpoIIE family protein phosphatase [Xanthomonadaceae bacterium]|nr:SpoIIE family protein phosphatase [Xanthomonadaceae bacterium]